MKRKKVKNIKCKICKGLGYIKIKKVIRTEEVPYSKKECAICHKFKPLIAVGKYKEETEMCEDCLNKKYFAKNTKSEEVKRK